MQTDKLPAYIDIFSEAIRQYFVANTGENPAISSAYPLERGGPIIWNEFNGMIEISGNYTGSICFSAPRVLLSHILLKMGESEFTEERHGDVLGDIANTIAGHAINHFGEGIMTSPPRLLDYSMTTYTPLARSLPYAIPLLWHGYRANLVIHLEAS